MKTMRFGVLAGVLTALLTVSIWSRGLADPPALSSSDKKQMASEVKQGAEIAEEIAKDPKTKFDTDSADVDRVNRIGQRVAAVANTTQFQANYGNDRVYPFVWHFSIIKEKDVNAFSLPGGYVYINSGLLKIVASDDELAGVLAHEITHAAHHHVVQLMHEQSHMTSNLLLGMLVAILAHVPAQDMGNVYAGASMYQQAVQNLKYGQAAERDADHGGVILMQKAGYNPLGMLSFMLVLKDRELRSPNIDWGIYQDHPLGADRVSAIQTQLAAMHIYPTPAALAKVDGSPRAAVRVLTPQTREVYLGTETLFTLADPDGKRSRDAAASLNKALDAGLRMMQVHAENNVLYAADFPVVQITPADAVLTPGINPNSIALAAETQLKKVLWAEGVGRDTASN